MRVYALSIHADYRCRHSGACCTADWDVPVEVPVYRGLAEALRAGRLQPLDTADDSPLITEPDIPDDAAAVLARTERGDCVFFDRPSGLCLVQRDVGESLLPATCRHFPRVAVRDARGTFITLSLFCPTAASMLFRDDVPLAIVESPPAFPPMDYGGLVVDASAWPPLLHPRMLMDLEGYAAWERHMVRRCADLDRLPESAVATLARDARVLRTWTPRAGALVTAVESLPVEYVPAVPPRTLEESLRLRAEVLDAVPDGLTPARDEEELEGAFAGLVRPVWESFRAPINRFLAVKAFASWTAYQGRGVLSTVRGVESALAVVRIEAARHCRDARRELDDDLLREAFRSADFLLHHLAVAETLAGLWSGVDG